MTENHICRKGESNMATNTKEALAEALKKMLAVKPIDKITVKDLVEECGVNRQTFYYHFDDVYDLMEWVFEEDANRVLPSEIGTDIVSERWRECVRIYFRYLLDNRSMVLNIFNSQNRSYMLRYYRERLRGCVHGFAVIVSEGKNIDWADLEYVVDFYVNGVVGLISMWLDNNMELPPEYTQERLMKMLEGSVEEMLAKFQKE
jgi:probable dihydroxyacetone kinase regulator